MIKKIKSVISWYLNQPILPPRYSVGQRFCKLWNNGDSFIVITNKELSEYPKDKVFNRNVFYGEYHSYNIHPLNGTQLVASEDVMFKPLISMMDKRLNAISVYNYELLLQLTKDLKPYGRSFYLWSCLVVLGKHTVTAKPDDIRRLVKGHISYDLFEYQFNKICAMCILLLEDPS